MRIVHLTSELSPLAKVGGLGDVVSGLSKALLKKGEAIEVILPFYDTIEATLIESFIKVDDLSIDGKEAEIWQGKSDHIPVTLIAPLSDHFKRETIYGEKDDAERFTLFCKFALAYLVKVGTPIAILNLHDWLTSFAAPLAREIYPNLSIGGIVTTLHNLCYQGVCKPDKVLPAGFPKCPFLFDTAKPKYLNLLKGGITYADLLTTVSPTYAQEIQREWGCGLEGLLKSRSEKLVGILNGIDEEIWDPTSDPYLKLLMPEDRRSVHAAKKGNRAALSAQVGIKLSEKPLFTCITRLVEQKGPELILAGIEHVLENGGQFILLGSSSEKKLKKKFDALAEKYEESPDAHFHFVFDEPLAHLTYAAADFILVPSLFEPCGLTQMLALRYGTIPLVHSVGGLADTIVDGENGLSFNSPTAAELERTIDRAFQLFRTEKHEEMIQKGMGMDWSWEKSAEIYLHLYRKASLSTPA